MSENLGDFLPAQSLAKTVVKHIKMTLNIIEQNYIFRHKYFTLYKVIGGLYFYFLLKLTSLHTDDSFLKYENEIEIASLSFIILSVILFFINSFSYSKEGKLKIETESIKLLKNGWKKTIDLKKVNSIKLEKLRGKEFLLKLDKFEINIEINPSELKALKELKTVTKINFGKPSIFNKLKSSLKIFANKNREFIEKSYRE